MLEASGDCKGSQGGQKGVKELEKATRTKRVFINLLETQSCHAFPAKSLNFHRSFPEKNACFPFHICVSNVNCGSLDSGYVQEYVTETGSCQNCTWTMTTPFPKIP